MKEASVDLSGQRLAGRGGHVTAAQQAIVVAPAGTCAGMILVQQDASKQGDTAVASTQPASSQPASQLPPPPL